MSMSNVSFAAVQEDTILIHFDTIGPSGQR